MTMYVQGWLRRYRTYLFYGIILSPSLLGSLVFAYGIDSVRDVVPTQVTLEELADTPEYYLDRVIGVRGFTLPGTILPAAQQCGAPVNGTLANNEGDLGGIRKVELAIQFPPQWSTYWPTLMWTTVRGRLRRQDCGFFKPVVWYIEATKVQPPR